MLFTTPSPGPLSAFCPTSKQEGSSLGQLIEPPLAPRDVILEQVGLE
jgi:hypothetical protein